jgi:hypothetical protein
MAVGPETHNFGGTIYRKWGYARNKSIAQTIAKDARERGADGVRLLKIGEHYTIYVRGRVT